MNYERTFFKIVILLLGISIITMTMILINIGLIPIILPMIAVPVLYFSNRQLNAEKPMYLSRFQGNMFALIMVLIILLLGVSINEPLVSILYFLFLLLFIKLLQKKKNRDYLQLILLSFTFMLISAIYQPAIWFLGIFITYIVIGLWSLIMLHFKKEADGDHSPDKKQVMNIEGTQFGKIFQGKFFAFITTLSILTITITTLGFMSMPRIQSGWLSPIMPPIRTRSGLSDTVQLGRSGKIDLDNRRALYVTWNEIPESEILYRAVTQPNYNAKTKRWVADEIQNLIFIENSATTWLDLTQKTIKTIGSTEVDIIDQQFNRQVQRFVTPGIPLRFELLQPKRKKFAIEYPAITIKSEKPLYEPIIQYTSKFLKSPKNIKEFWTSEPAETTRKFPENADLKEKYKRFNAEKCPPEPGKTGWNADRIRNLANILTSDPFTYSLNQPEIPENSSPIDYFLFEGHSGHCEYFASALTMLLLAEDINAHVVTGYASNPVNLQEIGGKWVDDIRYKQAHAWVEVEFADWGWVAFNPTPAGYIPQYEEMSGFDRFMSYVQYQYQRYILDFSLDDQQTIASDIKKSFGEFKDDIEKIGDKILATILGNNEFPTWLKLIIGFVVIALPVSGLILLFIKLRKKFKFRSKNKIKIADSLEIEFKSILRLLERIRRKPRLTSETFNDVISNTSVQELVDESSTLWLRNIYWDIRFNGMTLTDELRRKLRELISKIKQSRKNRRKILQKP